MPLSAPLFLLFLSFLCSTAVRLLGAPFWPAKAQPEASCLARVWALTVGLTAALLYGFLHACLSFSALPFELLGICATSTLGGAARLAGRIPRLLRSNPLPPIGKIPRIIFSTRFVWRQKSPDCDGSSPRPRLVAQVRPAQRGGMHRGGPSNDDRYRLRHWANRRRQLFQALHPRRTRRPRPPPSSYPPQPSPLPNPPSRFPPLHLDSLWSSIRNMLRAPPSSRLSSSISRPLADAARRLLCYTWKLLSSPPRRSLLFSLPPLLCRAASRLWPAPPSPTAQWLSAILDSTFVAAEAREAHTIAKAWHNLLEADAKRPFTAYNMDVSAITDQATRKAILAWLKRNKHNHPAHESAAPSRCRRRRRRRCRRRRCRRPSPPSTPSAPSAPAPSSAPSSSSATFPPQTGGGTGPKPPKLSATTLLHIAELRGIINQVVGRTSNWLAGDEIHHLISDSASANASAYIVDDEHWQGAFSEITLGTPAKYCSIIRRKASKCRDLFIISNTSKPGHRGHHWVLYHIRRSDASLTVYDSGRESSNRSSCDKAALALCKHIGITTSLSVARCMLQHDGNTCGLHAALNCIKLPTSAPPLPARLQSPSAARTTPGATPACTRTIPTLAPLRTSSSAATPARTAPTPAASSTRGSPPLPPASGSAPRARTKSRPRWGAWPPPAEAARTATRSAPAQKVTSAPCLSAPNTSRDTASQRAA